jgi:membrane protease YdiL (CAAX protease family)
LPAIALAMAWVVWFHGWEEASSRQVGQQPGIALFVGLVMGGLVAAGSQLAALRFDWVSRMAAGLAGQVGGLSPGVTLTMAALSAIGEEWVFRGVLQPGLGFVPATVLFGVVHIPIDRDLRPWPFLAMTIGGIMGGLYWWFEGLVAPIAMHFAINALNLRWLASRGP